MSWIPYLEKKFKNLIEINPTRHQNMLELQLKFSQLVKQALWPLNLDLIF
jgi:hypothetical protein